VFRQFDESPI
jgi:protein disulfide-isomerase A1